MTLLTVVRDVCAVVGVTAPTSVFTNINANRTMFEMLANANEMAQRIAYDTRDWTMLQRSNVYVGDGFTLPPDPTVLGTSSFLLPANFKRLLLKSNIWRSTSTQQPMRFIPDTDEWMRRRAANETVAHGEWTIYGGYMHIMPIMMPDTNAAFIYLDKDCVKLASGGGGDAFGDRFMDDADTFRLDERLLKLGMIWNWKKDKGSPYAENMGEYSDAIANAMGHDQPAPILIDRYPISNYARVSGSWPSSWGPQ